MSEETVVEGRKTVCVAHNEPILLLAELLVEDGTLHKYLHLLGTHLLAIVTAAALLLLFESVGLYQFARVGVGEGVETDQINLFAIDLHLCVNTSV